MILLKWLLAVCGLVVMAAGIALGQTNEIRVHGSDINRPDDPSITLHDTYPTSGRTGAN